MKDNDEKRGAGDGEYREKSEKRRREAVESFARSLLAESNESAATADGAIEFDTRSTRLGVEAERKPKTVAFDKAAEKSKRAERDGHRKRLRDALARTDDLSSADDGALLEALLSYFIPRKDVTPIADSALASYGSLWRALDASPVELEKIPSMTERAARVVSYVARLAHERETREIALNNRDEALAFLASLNAGDNAAKTHVVYLDADFYVIGTESFRGTVDCADVVRGVYARSAKSVIIGRRDSAVLPQWQNGAEFAHTISELLGAVEAVLLDIIVFTGLGYYSLCGGGVDGLTAFTFTPLATVRDVGAVLRSATAECDGDED